MKINICIPTYKRATSLLGKSYFQGAKYILPESQKDEYKKTLPTKQMVVIPDESDGNIARKRNWILKNMNSPLIMVDDDVESIGYFENRDGMKRGDHRRKTLDPKIFMDWAAQSFDLAEQFGAKMWGVAQNEDNRIYKEFHPISLRLPALGPFCAHLAHDIFYDERLPLKDDYDMSLQQLRKHKIILRWNKFHYICRHGDNAGGVVSYRTMKRERQQCEAIMKKWGERIIKYNLVGGTMSNFLNGKVNVPIRGV